ncbi:MAG: repressor LexA [Candidatus Omnitrophica bacterium]|nr:repressor LexA [Candidatus Omnitrophota bacterium]
MIVCVMDREKLQHYADTVQAFYRNAKRMPSYSELLSVWGFKSKNSVFKILSALVSKGFLQKDHTGRIISSRLQKPVRLLGCVQAGFPSPAEEETVDLMSLDEYLITHPASTFLLKVEGDSMTGAGIMPGDLILVQKNLSPKHGDIVVACVDTEWTLKYFEQRHGKVRLRAANKKYAPISPRQELIIGGVVIANVRKYK